MISEVGAANCGNALHRDATQAQSEVPRRLPTLASFTPAIEGLIAPNASTK